jgi:hypothetical protein
VAIPTQRAPIDNGTEVWWLSPPVNLFTFSTERADYDQQHAGKLEAGFFLNGLHKAGRLWIL